MADFKKSFEDVENYFSNRDDSLRDQKIHGDGSGLRFTEAHHDKAVMVEDKDQKRGLVGYKKRFRHSIILKFVTFKCLNRFTQKSIDTHFEYLNSIARSVGILAQEVCDDIENKVSLSYEAQIDTYNTNHIDSYVDNVCSNITVLFESFYNIVQKRLNESNLFIEKCCY